jgi:hypothetical protein
MTQLERIKQEYPEMQIGMGRHGYVIHNFDELPFNVAYGMNEDAFIIEVLNKM